MGHASNSVATAMWRHFAHSVSWRYCLTVLSLCFVLSTEVLFVPGAFEYWSLAQVVDGWLEQFADNACLGLFTMLIVTSAERLIGHDSNWRLLALVAVVVAAAGGGYAGLTWFHFPAGYYPPLLVLAGEALRVIVLGTMVTLVWAIQRRNARATHRIRQLDLHRVALQRRMLEAQLALMEAQIEPHFLLNTLATVKCLYQAGTASGERMLNSLRLYLGAALPKFRDEHPTLAGECALIGAYLDILHIRMGPRLQFAIDVPAALAEHAFPPMILLTLVENAIKHGLAPAAAGGRIEIAAALRGAVLEVSVSDNGVGFQSSCGSGIGLVNIRARLRALHGDAASLTLEQNLPHGVIARVDVPYQDGMPVSAPAPAPLDEAQRLTHKDTPHDLPPPAPPTEPWYTRLRNRVPHILLIGLAVTAMDELRKLPIDLDNHTGLNNLLSGGIVAINSLLVTLGLILAITLAEVGGVAEKWRVPLVAFAVCLAAPLASAVAVQISFLFNEIGINSTIDDFYGLYVHVLWTTFATGALAAAYFTVWERAQRSAVHLWAARLESMKSEQQMVESRLNVMKARVEPALLIREIATIQQLYRQHGDAAEQQLEHLITYLHAALPQMRDAPSTLGDELELAAAYLQLQAGAWRGRLAWRFEVDAQQHGLPFPPLAVLPLLDDALRRAALLPAASLVLLVRLQVQGSRFSVIVEDNCAQLTRDSAAAAAVAQHEQTFCSYFGGSGTVSRSTAAGATRVTMQADIATLPSGD